MSSFLKRLKREKRNTILYGHTAYGAIAASILSQVFGIPNVTRLYGSLAPFKVGLSKNYPTKGFLSKVKGHFEVIEELAAMKLKADHYILTNDGSLLDKLFFKFNSDDSKLTFVRNGIVVDWEKELQSKSTNTYKSIFQNPDLPIAFSCGRYIEWKRLDRLVDIANKIINERKFKMNFLLFAMKGYGSEAAERKVLSKIKEYGLEDFFIVKNNVPHEELIKYMKSSSAVLLVQDYLNLSNTLMEALVLQVPVFAIDVGGTNSVLRDNQNGFLISLSDWNNEFAEKILTYFEDKELQKKIKEGAIAWTNEHAYSWSERIKYDIEVINKLSKLNT